MVLFYNARLVLFYNICICHSGSHNYIKHNVSISGGSYLSSIGLSILNNIRILVGLLPVKNIKLLYNYSLVGCKHALLPLIYYTAQNVQSNGTRSNGKLSTDFDSAYAHFVSSLELSWFSNLARVASVCNPSLDSLLKSKFIPISIKMEVSITDNPQIMEPKSEKRSRKHKRSSPEEIEADKKPRRSYSKAKVNHEDKARADKHNAVPDNQLGVVTSSSNHNTPPPTTPNNLAHGGLDGSKPEFQFATVSSSVVSPTTPLTMLSNTMANTLLLKLPPFQWSMKTVRRMT